MPVPSVVEGRRVAVSDKEFQTVNFIEVHKSAPYVSVMLEPSDFSSYTSVFVKAVTPTSVTVRFSSPFSGYLHLHAFSVA